MTIHTIADITPNGAKVPLSTNPDLLATFVSVFASAPDVARVGDVNVADGVGLVLNDDRYDFYPANFDQSRYALNQIYVWAPSGATKISVIYGD